MAPSFAYHDSFPHQNGRVQCVPYFQPTPEAVPPKMMADPSPVPMFHGAGPYGANYSYPYHSCCSHVPFHSPYGYSPSYPPLLPPQPSPWWGPYAVYPPLVPVHPAPPACSAGIPRYEYDKDATGPGNRHCCGCPNHVCNPQNGEQSIRVEEEEPSSGGAVQPAPVNSRNFPYPIVWIPPEYVKNDEGKIPLESKSRGTSQELRSEGRSWQQEPGWRSLFPVQLEDLGLQKPAESDPRSGINQQLGDKRKQFQYPIIWMPYATEEEVERDQKDVFPKLSHQGLPSDSNANSVKNVIANDKIGESAVEGETGINIASKQACEKNIPAKEAESSTGNIHWENALNRVTDVSRKGVDKGKASSGRKEPASPKEKPKLPPVCLRVDPLPRRKKCTGSSRSPSPPCARENASAGLNDKNGRNTPAEVPRGKQFNEETRKQVKVIEVKDSPTGKKGEEMVMERRDEREEVGKGTTAHETVEVSQDNIASDGKTEVPRPLSSTEAVTLIQAAYRGFEVRRWDTKKKLKQMARIRDEAARIKKSIHDLESSHNASFDQEKFAKQRMVIGESIMSLLLTLDTIQGLHPSIRDVRKSLARELVTLQEKLDWLANRTSGEHIEKQFSASPEQYMHEVSTEDTNKQQEKSGKEDVQISEAISGYNEVGATDNVVESPEVQPLDVEASLSSPSEGESSGEMVDSDYGGQGLASSDMTCVEEEVKSNQSIEQVSELEKSWEDGKCGDMKVESDEVSSDGTVKIDASGGYEDPVSHNEGKGTELPVENEELDRSSVDEKESPREEDDGGDVSAAALCEVGAFAFPSEEITVVQPMEDVPMNGKEGQHSQEEDGGELLPEASFQDEGSTLQSEEREDEMASNTEALTQTEEVLGKQVDSCGEGSIHEKEMLENPNVAEVPDEQDVVVAVEDVTASEGAEALVDESKSGNSILGDELESNEKLLAENEKLREMMQKLMEAGKEQLEVISGLTGRVRDLEKKLAKNRKPRSRRSKISAAARPSRVKQSADSIDRALSDASM